MKTSAKLNLGCGKNILPGWVNMDWHPRLKPDVVHDLNQFPYPFPDQAFEEILCQEVLEHLDDVVRVMEELHRLLKPGGKLKIIVPHYSCSNAYTDPTHKHFFGMRSMDYFTGQGPWDFYTGCRFRAARTHLKFLGRYKNWFWEKLANRFPSFYEEHLAWIAPAWFITFELEAVKEKV